MDVFIGIDVAKKVHWAGLRHQFDERSGVTAPASQKAGCGSLVLAPLGITVNAICPGWVDTGFNAPIIGLPGGPEAHAGIVAAGVPLGRQATAADIAPAYLFLASSGARYITAKAIVIDGGVI
jgi:NAD(P)-dependent dehydrogenase (short-subunit alcohol dehydrogenase family)